jgi:nitroreductase
MLYCTCLRAAGVVRHGVLELHQIDYDPAHYRPVCAQAVTPLVNQAMNLDMNIRSTNVAEVIRERRTINAFKPERVSKDVVLAAIDLARWAPNHYLTEPWNFYLLSEGAKKKVVELNAELVAAAKDAQAAEAKRARWSAIPGWMVVTCDRSTDALRSREDYAACCCAIHSFSLYLWSQGVGVKWTTGDVIRDPRFYEIIWADPKEEEVVGLVWYGYPAEIPVTVRKPVSEIVVEI